MFGVSRALRYVLSGALSTFTVEADRGVSHNVHSCSCAKSPKCSPPQNAHTQSDTAAGVVADFDGGADTGRFQEIDCPNTDAEDATAGGEANVGGVNEGACPNTDVEDAGGEANVGGVNVGACPCPEGAVVVGGASVVGSGW